MGKINLNRFKSKTDLNQNDLIFYFYLKDRDFFINPSRDIHFSPTYSFLFNLFGQSGKLIIDYSFSVPSALQTRKVDTDSSSNFMNKSCPTCLPLQCASKFCILNWSLRLGDPLYCTP